MGEEEGWVVRFYTGTALEQSDFIRTFGAFQQATFEINRLNGWWDARDKILESGMVGAQPIVVIGCLGLVTSEVAEAMEAARKHDPKTWGDYQTKDTLVRELAGTVVRCMDLAERLGLPLGQAIVAELEANAERGYMHGGKAA